MVLILRNTDTGEETVFSGNVKYEVLGMEVYVTTLDEDKKEKTLVFSLLNHELKEREGAE